MKKFLAEFRAFALKGNVINLSVGIIIGAAFQGMVNSLTTNVLSPIIGLIAGQNFDSLKIEGFGITITYGAFITSVINFFIMAFIVFLLVKGMTKLLTIGKKNEEETPETRECPFCRSEISPLATRCPHCTSMLE